MRNYLCFLVTIFLICSNVVNAQKDVKISKSNFKTDKPGFSEAWRHIREGDSFYSKKGILYSNAFDEYLKAIVYNNSNPELNYKMGVSALFSDKKEEAAGFLLKALELKKDIAEDILFLTGRSLIYSGRYTEAVEKFNEYIGSSGKKSKENTALAKKFIEECNAAIQVTGDTLMIKISNAGVN
ncbi:MAG TPA: hypothetical protein PKM69_07670, partial [Bacteroidales bacterium]|nr:hypothetical protein [Bacteroidales bacterium]